MKTRFVYPGCFTPPTYGHFQIVRTAAEIFPAVTIVCSTNAAKSATRWFSEEECKKMWRYYDLPENVSIETFSESTGKMINFKKLVMIRGIRDEDDMENEKRVMKLNKKQFGIDKIFYILAEDAYADISASRVRKAAQELDFQTLAKCVPPAIVTTLLEKTLCARNIFMVVGQPGAGKSTFLQMLTEADSRNIHINTDLFSKALKPMIMERFGSDMDLIALAIERDRELTEFVAPLWLRLLAEKLRQIPADANVFLEIPYGLRPGKDLYRHVGHKVIYVCCGDQTENHRRIAARGTPEYARFVSEIPDLERSRSIATQHKLQLSVIDSSGNLNTLRNRMEDFLKNINTY